MCAYSIISTEIFVTHKEVYSSLLLILGFTHTVPINVIKELYT